MKKCFWTAMLIMVILAGQTGISLAVEYNEFTQRDNVSPYKAWAVSFSRPVYFHGIKEGDIYVEDESGAVVLGTWISYEHSKPYIVVLNPPASGWDIGKVYTLVVPLGIVSDDDMELGRPARMKFTCGYQSGSISLSLQNSNSIPILYRASVETQSPGATHYSIYLEGKSLTGAVGLGQKSVFTLDSGDAAKAIEVRTLSSSSESDVIEYGFFNVE